ncbi:hypothetical protein EF888_17750 [Silicimonas algicola]|uniref:Sulfotransferase family protein n=1 Tax=Silicimonas algicola TaxID=1826607 RepID=A0A316G7E2_9RHOB|nr:hypothetical protein [Silicimonas algicola]AZQ68811.1 hypothetical protein EF888_17750 [Silicimonas algicola]PWK56105.1 hypothetical protein C8D95_105171 [Silicimonas algicola]
MSRANRAEVTLHIGGAKCGSSAIQAFLKQNAAALAERGVLVPGKALDFVSEVTGEQIWAFEDGVAGGIETPGLPSRIEALLSDADKRGAARVILSAENMCNHPGLAPLLARVTQERLVRIVFYVRRQDDFLLSSWQQWYLKLYDTLEAFLADRVGRVACWYNMILPWAEAFGDDRITVRPFVRDRLAGHDIVTDFLDVTGLSAEGLKPLARAANPSFDEALARLAHRARDLFGGQHDNRFYEVMVRLLGSRALKQGSASSLLDLDTRHRILSRYAEDNEALRARFLPDAPGPLFAPPRVPDVRVESEAKQRSDEIAMLTRAVFHMAEKIERLEAARRSGS